MLAELTSEKTLNEERDAKYKAEFATTAEAIESTRRKIKTLMAELEESVAERIKVPQVQILHTEYSRLQDQESKGVETLVKRKADIKSYSLANGGKLPPDDGLGIVIRKDLTSIRSKLKIVKGKIKKFGALGKIPMGAAMRIYHEEESTDSEVSSSTEEEEESEGSSVDLSAGDENDKMRKIQEKKKAQLKKK